SVAADEDGAHAAAAEDALEDVATEDSPWLGQARSDLRLHRHAIAARIARSAAAVTPTRPPSAAPERYELRLRSPAALALPVGLEELREDAKADGHVDPCHVQRGREVLVDEPGSLLGLALSPTRVEHESLEGSPLVRPPPDPGFPVGPHDLVRLV